MPDLPRVFGEPAIVDQIRRNDAILIDFYIKLRLSSIGNAEPPSDCRQSLTPQVTDVGKKVEAARS